MSLFLALEDAMAEYLHDGDTVAFEGFSHLIPQAAGHEAIRQKRRDLLLVRMTPDIIYDQMIGMGCARGIIFSYAGNPSVGLLRRLRDAIEHGWPNAIAVTEHSHSGLAHAYQAGASGLPCALFRGYRGAELVEFNPDIRTVTCPFSGEKLAAVPAVRPDLAIIHAQRADRRGNLLIEGVVGVQKEAVLASRRAIATVEEIVEDIRIHPNACILPHWTLDAICVVPGGAHPSYAHGYYRRDNAFYKAWDGISADRDRFLEWMQKHVLETSPAVFAERVSHLRNVP